MVNNPANGTVETFDLLKTAAETKKVVLTADDGTNFNDKLHCVVDAERGLVAGVDRLVGYCKAADLFLAEALAFRDKLGLDAAESQAALTAIHLERDNALRTTDFTALWSFYNDVAVYLDALAEAKKDGLTANERAKFEPKLRTLMIKAVNGVILNKHVRKLLLQDPAIMGEIMKAITGGVDVKAFRTTLENKLEGTDEALDRGHKSARLAEMLKLLNISDKFANNALSRAAIYGMVGRVPNAKQMEALFNGDMPEVRKFIKSFAPASFEFCTSRSTFHMYCGDKEDKTIDEAVKGLEKDLKAVEPSKILWCHIRTDADVVKLLKDMSDGEFLHAQYRTAMELGLPWAPDCDIHIEGRTAKNEVVIHDPEAASHKITPDTMLAHPMEKISHRIEFYGFNQSDAVTVTDELKKRGQYNDGTNANGTKP